MTIKVFVSYRRRLNPGEAGRIADRLIATFGEKNVFIDVHSIPLGQNFATYISDRVDECDAFLAIIGRGWLNAKDKNGNRRLENPNDFVRLEIAAGLRRKIRLIPVLIENTPMPKADRLPEDIRELSRHQKLSVRHESFDRDVESLIRDLTALDAEDDTSFPWAPHHVEQYETYGMVEFGQRVVVLRPPRRRTDSYGSSVLEKGMVTRKRD
jgi:hypothetical protein